MSLLGIGPPELIMVLLVALIFLGPTRMIELARLFGKLTREIRKMTAEVREMVDVDDIINPRPADKTDQTGVPQAPSGSNPASESDATENGTGSLAESDGPVSFKSARQLHREKLEAEAAAKEASSTESQEGQS